MINIIFYKNFKLVGRKKEGRCNYFILENGEQIKSTELSGEKICIQCYECGKNTEIKFYQGENGLLKRKYICQTCDKLGYRNGFYGKKHSEEFKTRLSKERKGLWYIGENAPMFGRNVWKEMSPENVKLTKDKISKACSGEKNGFYGKKHTQKSLNKMSIKHKKWFLSLSDKEREEYSKKLSTGQQRAMQENPDKYRENKRKAAFKSVQNSKRYKINKIEKIVLKELENRKLYFQYGVILNYKQFDFGNKKYRILLEVQGDYWHANPKKYGFGEGKRKINDIQKSKLKQDKEKIRFASKHNIKLFHIWEEDIRKGNFQVLDKIKEYINEPNKI